VPWLFPFGGRRRSRTPSVVLVSDRGTADTEALNTRFTDTDLAMIRDFLRLGNDFYERQISRIEQLSRRAGR
jgi:hypothetical protein